MIFSVQNSNLMHSVEFSPGLVQIQVREAVSGIFLARTDIPIQVCHMVEVMRSDFNEHHLTQVPMTENQLEEMPMTEEVSDHEVMINPEIPDSKLMAQPVDDFLFPWEEVGSAENPITIDEDEGFSETMTPQNTPPLQPPAMEPRPALRSIENLHNSSAARQLFDQMIFVISCCLVFTLFFVIK